MSGVEFESQVAWLFRAEGWTVTLTGTTGDGGADLVMTRDLKKIVVQCKAHVAPQGSPVLRDLLGTKQDFNADGAILCALSGVTPAAKDFADRNEISILTLGDLVGLAARLGAGAG